MKKKTAALLIALGLMVSLAACGSDGAAQTPAPSQNPPAQSGAPSESQAPDGSVSLPDSYVFLAGDFTISIGQNMAEVLAALGEPQSYFEAASCAFEGLDKTYTYSGFQITTRPEGDKDYVNSILLTDDSVTTPEGLYIGASKDDLEAIYGAGGDFVSSANFTMDGVTLSVILENNVVISIEYLPA